MTACRHQEKSDIAGTACCTRPAGTQGSRPELITTPRKRSTGKTLRVWFIECQYPVKKKKQRNILHTHHFDEPLKLRVQQRRQQEVGAPALAARGAQRSRICTWVICSRASRNDGMNLAQVGGQHEALVRRLGQEDG